MISVLKLNTGEFIIAQHKESDEAGSTVRVQEPFVVDWRVGKDGVPYILLMRWMVGVRNEWVTLTKGSIVAIFSPTAHLEDQYTEALEKSSELQESDDEDEVSNTDLSFLDELVERMRNTSLREENDSLEEKLKKEKKYIAKGNDTKH